MFTNEKNIFRAIVLISVIASVTFVSTHLRADTGTCAGASITLPFTDVPNTNAFFCSIAEAYFSALTNGTTATTYSPGDPVLREQMAAFVTRTLDQSLKRGSRRGAINQWYSPTTSNSIAKTAVGDDPEQVASDGADLWVTNYLGGTVSRVRASDGKLLETWTGASGPFGVVVARGRVYVTGRSTPGRLYEINPTQAAGVVTLVADTLGQWPIGIAFDGVALWTANVASVSRIDPVSQLVVNFTEGFDGPKGILYDGANVWVTDAGTGTLLKLNSIGDIIQTITVGGFASHPIFDGTNIWVPNYTSNTVSVVRASTGAVVATLSGNGLNSPHSAAFDGERILVTNQAGDSVSLWKAADLTRLGSFATGTNSRPWGACSDGLNFWVTLGGTDKLARF